MKIKIYTNTSEKIKELSEITSENQQGYAKKHGYEWGSYYFDYSRFNETVLESLEDLKEQLAQVDVLMTVGADVMFTNWKIKVEDILVDKDCVVIARERTGWWPVNNDVMLYVNRPETFRVIDQMIEDYDIWKQYVWRTQQHIWNMKQELDWADKAIRIVEAEVMNQSMKRWQIGEFIVHFYGMPLEEKIKNAYAMAALFPDGMPVFKINNEGPLPNVVE
jgi:hypothetical protein